MAATAVRPRRLTAAKRAALTPEQELEYLIAEQAADDARDIDIPRGQVSLDTPFSVGDGDGTIGSELIGYDPWGLVDAALDAGTDAVEAADSATSALELANGSSSFHLRPRRGDALSDPRKIPHGTRGGYQNHKCRCDDCRGAEAEYRRNKRAAARAAS